MNLGEITKLINKTGGKYIIVEDNAPKYVIMDFSEFRKMLESGGQYRKLDFKERINGNPEDKSDDIAIRRGANNDTKRGDFQNSSSDEKKEAVDEIKIEDLPF